MIFFYEKDSRFSPGLIHKTVFSLDKYQLKNMGGGGTLSKCSKTLYYKNVLETYFVKPVGKYHFAVACIRALV